MAMKSTPDWSADDAPRHAAAPAAKPRAALKRRVRLIGWSLLPPLTFVAIVGFWWGAVKAFKIPAYLLPGPGDIFSRLVADYPMLWTHSKITLTEIVLGFALTVVTAIPLGLVIALSLLAKQVLYPPIMLLQLVPR